MAGSQGIAQLVEQFFRRLGHETPCNEGCAMLFSGIFYSLPYNFLNI
jgi:hypothetical protein